MATPVGLVNGVLTNVLGVTPAGDRAQDIGTSVKAFDNLYIDGISWDDGANFMTDFEDGTWTPVITSSGGAGDAVYSGQVGNYIKIADWVMCSYIIQLSSKGTLPGGVPLVGPLPFTVGASNAEVRNFVYTQNTTYSGSGTVLGTFPTIGLTTCSTQSCNGSGGASNQAISDLTNTTLFTGNLMYVTN